MCSETAL